MNEPTITFTAVLDKFADSPLWGHHIPVSETLAKPFITDDGDRRVVCTLNDKVTFQCALMPKGDGGFFININKKIRDTLRLKEGSTVEVTLRKDHSKYGLPMPEELEELLRQDAVSDEYFHALKPGKQRTLLYMIGNAKRPDTRLKRAIIIVEHLKTNNGKIDYKILNQALKEGL